MTTAAEKLARLVLEEVPPVNYQYEHEMLRLAREVLDEVAKAPKHVCGLQGYDPMKGDYCEACDRRNEEWLTSKAAPSPAAGLPDEGWLQRGMTSAAEATKDWPEWKRKAAAEEFPIGAPDYETAEPDAECSRCDWRGQMASLRTENGVPICPHPCACVVRRVTPKAEPINDHKAALAGGHGPTASLEERIARLERLVRDATWENSRHGSWKDSDRRQLVALTGGKDGFT